jgi:hypothetical protein
MKNLFNISVASIGLLTENTNVLIITILILIFTNLKKS